MDSLKSLLIQLETRKLKEKKEWIKSQEIRLGRIGYKRVATRFTETWEEGEEFLRINGRLVLGGI